MRFFGTEPNDVTYLLLLYVCNHAGMVERAFDYFGSINVDAGMLPNLRHYACMMDILGRAGDFCKARSLLKIMPLEGDLSFWMGLLGACRIHGNSELGEHAFDLATRLHPTEACAYIMMSNIYGEAHQHRRL
jgi:pentatricopeptide repeat protein